LKLGFRLKKPWIEQGGYSRFDARETRLAWQNGVGGPVTDWPI